MSLQDDGRDLAIVSDLHLSAGYDDRTGAYDRNEDFFYDAAFARFLTDLERRADAEGRRWRLVILGDLFDFLQVDTEEGGAGDTSEGVTLAKLSRVARGHRELFAALGRFAARFPIDVVAGNHDIELVHPVVQRRLVQLLVDASGSPAAREGVSFHPWIYYLPGVLYAEHGNQYDDVNSFATPLDPFVDGQVDLPLGSYFVTHLFNRIESIDPFADNVRPATGYLLWALQHRPVRTLATLGAHFHLLVTVLRRSKDLTPAQVRDRRVAYRAARLPAYAAEVGLSYETLAAIDRLASIPAMSDKLHQMRAILLAPLLEIAPAIGALVATYLGIGRLRPGLRGFSLFALGVAGLIWRERRSLQPVHADRRMERIARRIRRILMREGKGVPVYVFGHTHAPEQSPLTKERRPPYYLNSGTWTPTVAATFELLSAREMFTFVQVTRERDTGRPIPRLMIWNDNAGRAEPLAFLSPSGL